MSVKVVLILANSTDSGDAVLCYISSGSSLFAIVPVEGCPIYTGLIDRTLFILSIPTTERFGTQC